MLLPLMYPLDIWFKLQSLVESTVVHQWFTLFLQGFTTKYAQKCVPEKRSNNSVLFQACHNWSAYISIKDDEELEMNAFEDDRTNVAGSNDAYRPVFDRRSTTAL